MPKSTDWTRQQVMLAFYLYCQLPFGKLHSKNPDIVRMAVVIGRTASAVAMKLSNFASLDPSITDTGRTGLRGASALDREIWNAFHQDWERLADECEQLLANRCASDPYTPEARDERMAGENYAAENVTSITKIRQRQAFFRRAVLAAYRGRCCMSEIAEPRLLIASHIVPWHANTAQRLNPRNGLCLSSLHDRAFDVGLITVTPEHLVLCSPQLHRLKDPMSKICLLDLQGKRIAAPARFGPDQEFLSYHREHIYLAN